MASSSGVRSRVPGWAPAVSRDAAGQRAGAAFGQLGGFGGDVDADADDDGVGGRLGQDPDQLAVAGAGFARAGQDVVGPFQAGCHAGHAGDRLGHGHPGEQWQPAAPGRGDAGPYQQGERQRGARPRDPACGPSGRGPRAGPRWPARCPPARRRSARASRSALVDPVLWTTSTVRQRPPVRTAARRSAAGSSGGRTGVSFSVRIVTNYCSGARRREIGDRPRNEPAQRRRAGRGRAWRRNAAGARRGGRGASGYGRRRSPGTRDRSPRGPRPPGPA